MQKESEWNSCGQNNGRRSRRLEDGKGRDSAQIEIRHACGPGPLQHFGCNCVS